MQDTDTARATLILIVCRIHKQAGRQAEVREEGEEGVWYLKHLPYQFHFSCGRGGCVRQAGRDANLSHVELPKIHKNKNQYTKLFHIASHTNVCECVCMCVYTNLSPQFLCVEFENYFYNLRFLLICEAVH